MARPHLAHCGGERLCAGPFGLTGRLLATPAHLLELTAPRRQESHPIPGPSPPDKPNTIGAPREYQACQRLAKPLAIMLALSFHYS